MCVYSITARTSFEEIATFREQILRVKDADKVPLVLVGNKCDLEREREVSTQEGKELAKSFDCPFLETSARSRINVEEAFFELVREIRKAKASANGKASDKKKGKGKKKCIIL